MNTPKIKRRGITTVLAMLYLVLISTLAIGFYAATTMSSQISSNDDRVARAYFAAESGMDFMRHTLSRVRIPPNTQPDEIVEELHKDLVALLEDTGNFSGLTIGHVGNTISIPAEPDGVIPLDQHGHAAFRATITDWAGDIVVKVNGRAGKESANRAISMDFKLNELTATAFNNAIASRGQINIKKGGVTTVAGVDPRIATVMSARQMNGAITVTGGEVGGELRIVPDATADVTGGTVAGSSIPTVILKDHVKVGDAPDFPEIDTRIYAQYATNTYSNGTKTQQNIRIPAGTNPRFAGGDTVQGIMYVESPNTVTFRGNFNLDGFIVFENAGDGTSNVLDFRGAVNQSPLPDGAQFDPLRSTSGVAVMAPSAAVKMSGSSGSHLRGNLLVDTFHFDGAGDVLIDRGTVMAYNDGDNSVNFAGKTFYFTATGLGNAPNRVFTYSSYFVPDPSSYQELMPEVTK
jgi:hypothetical protein